MSWKTVSRIGFVLVAMGVVANLGDIRRYLRISTM
jgi:Family of unknown function (DUF6893)